MAGKFIPCRVKIWAAGNTASFVGKTLGVPVDRAGRVIVQDDLTIPGHPEVQVIGDLANFTPPRRANRCRAFRRSRSRRGGTRRLTFLHMVAGAKPQRFYYWDKGSMATIGRNRAVADLNFVHFSGFLAWLAWLFVHVIYLVGFRNRIVVLFQWAWAYVTFNKGARLITRNFQAEQRPLGEDGDQTQESAKQRTILWLRYFAIFDGLSAMRSRHVLPNFRIAIVGSGAIGLYYGGKLAHFGRDVHFLLRSDYDAVRKRGLRIRSKKRKHSRARRCTPIVRREEIGACDLVIVAVKTTSNPELPPLIAPLLGEKTMILTLQNGLGNEDFLAEHFGAERILGGLCYISLNRTAPGVVERLDAGRLTIGEYRGHPQPRTHDVAWEFKRCWGRLQRGGRSRRWNAGASWSGTFPSMVSPSWPAASTRPRFWLMTDCNN